MKTAVVGATGYLGAAFHRAYGALGTSRSRPGPGLVPFDLAKPDLAPLRLRETGHEAVLVASAMTGFKPCEDKKDLSRAVNVDGTLELARQCGREGLRVIFLSSDVVFAGDKGPYADDAATAPATEYGRQKAQVEKELPALAPKHLILRLSKVFGLAKGDGTLFDDMARSLSEGKPVQAAEDHIFCPTEIGDLVRAALAVQASGANGLLNLCAPEYWSRYKMATALAGAMGADPGLVRKIRLYDLPGMAGRPRDTSMACSRLQKEVAPAFLPLQDCIERVAAHYRPF